MRILSGIFITVFMAMLTIPLVFVDLSSDRISVQENRMLAQRPSLADIKNHPATFIREFDAWFKDSTGFRERLMTLYNVINKNIGLYNVRYTDGQYVYLIGQKGHHYFADDDGQLISKFQGRQYLFDSQLTNMAAGLEEVKKYLDKQGIPLIVMFCTDKESIYPEFYPKSIKRGPEPIQLDVITGYLQEHTTVDVFNIRQALLAEKNNFMLYPVSSGDLTHYNQIAAFFAYRELMRHINNYFPEIIPYELDNVDISYDENEIPHVSLTLEKKYKKLDPSFFDDVNISRPFTWENIAYENEASYLPVILFLRDSYTSEDFFDKYNAQHFGKTIMIYYMNMEHFEEYIDKYKPDIVVFESAERGIGWFANIIGDLDLFGEIELNYIAHIPMSQDVSIGYINGLHSLDILDDSMVLYCGDDDPMVFFPLQEPITRPSDKLYIEIECTNSKSGTLTIFYDLGEGLNETNKSRLIIKELPEMTKIRLRIIGWQAGANLYSIRIDPPDDTRFEIKSIKFGEK